MLSASQRAIKHVPTGLQWSTARPEAQYSDDCRPRSIHSQPAIAWMHGPAADSKQRLCFGYTFCENGAPGPLRKSRARDIQPACAWMVIEAMRRPGHPWFALVTLNPKLGKQLYSTAYFMCSESDQRAFRAGCKRGVLVTSHLQLHLAQGASPQMAGDEACRT